MEKNLAEEFAGKFPGKCALCSYSRFGKRELGIDAPPIRHVCIEAGGAEIGVDPPPRPGFGKRIWEGIKFFFEMISF